MKMDTWLLFVRCNNVIKCHLTEWFVKLERGSLDIVSQTAVTAKIMYFGLCECHCLVSAKLHGVM